MGRRNLHTREQQREMAIAAAELILVREGLAGLTMRKVADAIGYTVGNLYLLFENQDQLLMSVNERTGDAIFAALRFAFESEDDPRLRLRGVAAAYVEFALKHASRWRLMFEHTLPSDAPRPHTVEQRIKSMFDLVETSLAPLVGKAGPARMRLHATTLWSSVHGICTLAVTGKLRWSGADDYRPFSDHLVDTFLQGLSHKRAPSRR
ncbi:MAG TPA: TetR/AcrR family transcriptional regulator [Nevskiaceae bacterium]|nr:TetR/AcrR family transcriptional regulator [Nevskiaceae bacterium]